MLFDHFERVWCKSLAALRAFPNSISPQQPDHKSQFVFVFLTLYKQEWFPKQHILSQPLLSHSASPTSITISPPSPPAPPLAAPPVATLWPLTMVPLQWCAAGLPLGGGHLARRAAAGCAADSQRRHAYARCVGLRRRHFLLGRRSHPADLKADLHDPINLCQGVCCCPWGMYSLKPVRRGGMMYSGATLHVPRLRDRKLVLSRF